MPHFDLVVLGCGGIGSAALFAAAQAGLSVLGIDRWTPPHRHGSSHGQTRVIRQAYFEHPDYVPLIRQAYRRWQELEHLSGERLLIETGILEVGPPDGEVVSGVLRSAQEHDLPVAELSAQEVQSLFPRFQVPEGYAAVFEAQAGYLFVEKCIEANLNQARRAGAMTQFDCQVFQISRQTDRIRLATQSGEITCDRLIVVPGAFATSIFSDLQLNLRVLRKHLHWFDCDTQFLCHDGRPEPVFYYETQTGGFYGFPPLAPQGFKVAEHTGGELITDPAAVPKELDQGDLQRVQDFLAKHLRGNYRHQAHQVCMYTMTSTGNFVVDFHPQDRRIVLACGFSGHGFKFASSIGHVLVEMATSAKHNSTASFLSLF